MIVAGGTYRERCVAPAADLLFGSGGRAALALRDLERTTLHTFHPDAEEVQISFGADAIVHPSPALMTFDYLHPLARPRISPDPHPWCGLVPVQGETVIRFGCLEGEFVVSAEAAIYDPQSGSCPRFGANGSRAQRLAMVLNAGEARNMAGLSDLVDAGRTLRRTEGAEVVVVKDGPSGALVFDSDDPPSLVAAHWTPRLFKIGSGDVFTATFAHHWATRGCSATEAAALASRHVAAYVANRTLPCKPNPVVGPPVRGGLDGATVGLAVQDRGIASNWLRHEARQALFGLGAGRVVPMGEGVACEVLLALVTDIVDTTFHLTVEATSRGIPCVAYTEHAEAARRLREAGIAVVMDDFAASVYATAWSLNGRTALLWRD